ncbi:hypothetical protein BT96DRAFT_926012 [Gymnopus androsaceus JB14]|uniref:Uncharacterized protein n=1 Tax=Gymnopus androsaceus JB14 TaxID=1447944 RepID=A0A6A4GZ32_9AGAR|nr:hypothetical protein BT96DRAFT_926012 [Gymnopus androsaceus JB14]
MAEEFRKYMNEEVKYVIITTITKVEEFKKHQLLYIPNAKIPLSARSTFTTTSFDNYVMNNPASVWKGLASNTAVVTKDTDFGHTMYVPPNIHSASNPFGIKQFLMRYDDAFKAEKNHPVADWKQLNIYNSPNDF